jgi:hypothetical protein
MELCFGCRFSPRGSIMNREIGVVWRFLPELRGG